MLWAPKYTLGLGGQNEVKRYEHDMATPKERRWVQDMGGYA